MKNSTLLLVGAAIAAYFLVVKKGTGTDGYNDTLGRGEAGSGAITTGTGAQMTLSAPSIVPSTIREARLTPANLAEPLVTSGGTSSPAVIAANLAASAANQSYNGMSSGVQYTVSAPHAPSPAHAAALRQYGY
jgi:hypothetical protein